MIATIISLVSGALGGNAAGALMKNLSLGTLWNSVAGIVQERNYCRKSIRFSCVYLSVIRKNCRNRLSQKSPIHTAFNNTHYCNNSGNKYMVQQ